MSKRAIIQRSLLVLLGLTVVAAIAIPVYAHCGKCAIDGSNQAAALSQSKMTLAAAATLAEVKTKGTAVRARVHQHGSTAVIQVLCIVDGKVMAVEVNSTNAEVTKPREVKDLAGHQH